MKELALLATLLLASSPAAAQITTAPGQGAELALPNGQKVFNSQGGIFCTEEMTATFCNQPTGPNTSGYGSSGGTTSTITSSTTTSSTTTSGGTTSSGTTSSSSAASVRPCVSGTPANELCD